jgi:RNA polymerase sigma-70 factor, ECF subfamily
MANMPPANGSKNIRGGLAGDPEAFATLVKENQKMVFAVAFRMTGSVADAEDLTQETFLRASQHLDGFRAQSKFSTWVCQIAVNLGLNWQARESRRGAVHIKWAEDLDSAGRPGSFPDELSQRVQDALNKLPAKQRAAIVLTIYENQSHAEAAKILNCSEATVSWRVFAARRKLKRLLKGILP